MSLKRNLGKTFITPCYLRVKSLMVFCGVLIPYQGNALGWGVSVSSNPDGTGGDTEKYSQQPPVPPSNCNPVNEKDGEDTDLDTYVQRALNELDTTVAGELRPGRHLQRWGMTPPRT